MSFNTSTLAADGKKSKANKLVLGFVSLTALLLVSTAGAVGATSSAQQNGNGYGGIHNNIDLNVNVNGNNNVVQVIIQFFFG
jgi:hypothetical protein